jgi:hypothetical protein
MLRNLVLLGCGVVLLSTASAPAQDAVLGQLYGNGVHAYFAGDFTRSYEQLSAAVTAGSRDPRVYYFRGMAYLKLGRAPEATLDFQKGAELESKDLNRSFNVARSLERIQGPARQQLETYRVDARLAALAEADKIRKARFEAIQREEQRVLRSQAAAASENVPAPEGEPADKAATEPQSNVEESKPADGAATDDKAEMPADSSGPGGEEKAAHKPTTTPFEEEPVTTDKAATPAVEKIDGEKPAGTEKKSGPIKQSILGALIKGSQSELKKTLGGGVKGLGGLVPGGPSGMGPGMSPGPGSPVPPGATVPPGAPAPGPGFGDFGTPGDEKAAPPQKATPDKPADKPADEKDPFDA